LYPAISNTRKANIVKKYNQLGVPDGNKNLLALIHLTGHIMLVTANPIVKFNQWLSFSVEIFVIGYNAQKCSHTKKKKERKKKEEKKERIQCPKG
jgi:L-asparagine transporter-like permease